ncbi:MAG: hypothetical protein NZ733_03400, partial [Aigarchaeota archaeon]|nr:hypothetical protein [Aigarchaeota archaeon]
HIDGVRFITNPSSGKMGIELARSLRSLGAGVTLVHGPIQVRTPLDVRSLRVASAREMLEACLREGGNVRGFFAAAAVSDYELDEAFRGKIETRVHRELALRLRATPKIVSEVKRAFPQIDLVVFKAVFGMEGDPVEVAGDYRDLDPVMVAINDVSREGLGFGSDENELLVVTRRGLVERIGPGRKSGVARALVELYLREVRGSEVR